jgi:hypothetical protein
VLRCECSPDCVRFMACLSTIIDGMLPDLMNMAVMQVTERSDACHFLRCRVQSGLYTHDRL